MKPEHYDILKEIESITLSTASFLRYALELVERKERKQESITKISKIIISDHEDIEMLLEKIK